MSPTAPPVGRVLAASLFICGGLTIASCADEASTPTHVDIEAHLYGPGARLGRGITVPEGAARVGPTIPIDEDQHGVTSLISLLQIDGDPDRVMHDLLADLARRVPDAGVEPDKARRRCWLDDTDEWIRQCRLLVAGHTAAGEPLQVDVTVTPTADAAGEPLPGASGLPQARLLIRYGIIRGVGTNLNHPRGFAFSIRDQEAARWPIASDAETTLDATVDTVPGTETWPVQAGGFPIGVVFSDPSYAVVAVDEGESVREVATNYILSVPNTRMSTEVLATVGERTTTSYEIDAVDGGAGAHLWAIDRPSTDYLFLRYWPPRT